MRFVFLLLLLVLPAAALASSKTDSLFEQLKHELSQKETYDRQKDVIIQKLKHSFRRISANNLPAQYSLCLKLYDEYKSYQYDSAYVYALKLQNLSLALKDKSKEGYSKIKMAFILISSGMFKETFDNLNGVNVSSLDTGGKFEYYSLMTRAYYDLAEYDNDKTFSSKYNVLANRYIDSSIALSKPDSYDKIYLQGYKQLKNNNLPAAQVYFETLLNKHQLSLHQNAIVTSTLSEIYRNTSKENRIDLLIEASISDIRSSTKETLALFWLAELLYKTGEIKDTYFYLEQAKADADFYGARQRTTQIGRLLPIVAADRMSYIEREKNRFLIYVGSVSILAILVIWISIMLFKQLNQLKVKEKIIDDKNIQLEKINEKLVEGTKIKEEYIGYFFNVISGYILQLEKLKRSVDMKLHAKKYEDIQILIDKINIKKERDSLFYTFDHVFIKIFPNFVSSFNAMFKEEDQIWPKEDEVLTTDLRIFALIRMGISDTETIAKILEYSEKTIYVYKMRIKAKAIITGDDFEHQIMAIKAVDTSNTDNR